MMIKSELLELINKANSIAAKYANLLHSYGGSVYRSPSFTNNGFTFSIGPTTHGLSKSVSLPIDLLFEDDISLHTKLSALAEEQLTKWKEERLANTCKECGHIKFNQDLFNV